jgi:hypothetical protein
MGCGESCFSGIHASDRGRRVGGSGRGKTHTSTRRGIRERSQYPEYTDMQNPIVFSVLRCAGAA